MIWNHPLPTQSRQLIPVSNCGPKDLGLILEAFLAHFELTVGLGDA